MTSFFQFKIVLLGSSLAHFEQIAVFRCCHRKRDIYCKIWHGKRWHSFVEPVQHVNFFMRCILQSTRLYITVNADRRTTQFKHIIVYRQQKSCCLGSDCILTWQIYDEFVIVIADTIITLSNAIHIYLRFVRQKGAIWNCPWNIDHLNLFFCISLILQLISILRVENECLLIALIWQ